MKKPDESEAAFERYLRKPGPEALAPVVRLLHHEVWRIALRVTGNEEDASDVTQDLFLGLLLSPPPSGSVRSPRGYLAYRVLTLAARRARAAARREKREAAAARRLSIGDASPPDIEALRHGIEHLPDRVRAAVELHYLAGYTCREIAELTGVSERTVASDLEKGREALRQRLGAAAPGLFAALSSARGSAAEPPPALLEDLLRVVASGSALAPLATSSLLGAVIMKKLIVAVACAAILGGGWITIRSISRRPAGETPAVAVESRARDGAVAPALAPQAASGPGPAAFEDSVAAGPVAVVTVTDEEGRAITAEAAVVRGNRRLDLEGKDGRFEVPLPAAGEDAMLVVAAKGYFPEEMAVSKLAEEARQVMLMAVHDLEVRTVVKASGAPLPGCEVHVHRGLSDQSYGIGSEPSDVLESDGSGQAVVQGLRSTDKLQVFALSEALGIMSGVEDVKAPFERMNLLLEPMEHVRGRVLDGAGVPVTGAHVWLLEASWTSKLDRRILRGFDYTLYRRLAHELDMTDDQGRFRLRWLAGRRPVIAAGAEGLVVDLRELLEEEIGGEVELVLEPSAHIEGVVLDEKGQPATSGVVFSVAGDDPEKAEALKPWRVYYHTELNVPHHFVLKDIERNSANYLIVDHRGKYHREVVPLDDEQRRGKRQVEVRLRPDPSRMVPVELAVKPFDRVTGNTPIDPYPQVSVLRLPSEEAMQVHGNNTYGGFAWWCAVEPGPYRVEVATPGFLAARETIVVPEDPEGRSQSGCCEKQFRLDVPIERDPAQQGRFDLPELLQLELLDGRDRKPPPEDREVVWQAFRDPGGEPAFDEIRATLRHEDGAARLRRELAAGKYTVRVGCEGFRETTLAVTLPQASPVIEVLLPPEWKDAEEARAAIPHLVLELRHDRDERARAARALARIGHDAAEPLMELFSDADLHVRLAAIHASADLRPIHPGTLERIVPLLADPEPHIRAGASQALAKLGDEAGSAISDLIRLLDDPVDHVRSAAASALGMLGPLARDARASLELLLDDEYEWARLNAKRALERIAGGERSEQ